MHVLATITVHANVDAEGIHFSMDYNKNEKVTNSTEKKHLCIIESKVCSDCKWRLCQFVSTSRYMNVS